MAKERDKKVGKDQILLEASRLGQYKQIESILSQLHTLKSKKKTNPLASLRKSVGPNSIRDPVTGFTCLHHAALNGHSDCVKLMLDYGAKANALDYKGSSALHLAAWAGNLDVVKALLAHSATLASSSSSPSSSSPSKSTSAAITTQDSIAASEQATAAATAAPTTLESPNNPKFQLIDVNLCNNDNQTPISLAAQFGHKEVVCELLEYGANVNIRNNQLESPLDLACLNGRLETVDLLLKQSIHLRQDLRRPRSTIPTNDEVVSRSGSQLKANSSSGSNERVKDKKQENNKSRQPLVNMTNSTSQANTSAHVRRPSGSWASLLLGRRQDSSTSQQQQQQQQSPSNLNQSPFHRLTVAGLSLRQKSSSNHQQEQDYETANYLNATEKRRATLTSGITLQQKQLQNYKQMSVDGWFGDQDQTINNVNKQLQQDAGLEQTSLKMRETLLDHSPLHYATRRGHLSVANLLLYTYEANLLQVSSLGSVLHEIAINNGKHSDMISLFYIYINNKQPEKRIEFLEQFLNLKDSQNKNVFQVLNEINNRSAQEVKRLIYEYSEQLQRQPIQPSSLSSGGKQGQSNNDAVTTTDSKMQYDALYSLNKHYQPNVTNTQQQHVDTCSSQQQQFGDIQQINSFVTMKRVPKNQRMKEQILEDSMNKHLYQQQRDNQLMNYQYAGCTQTIDRRRPTSSLNQLQYQQQCGFDLQLRQKPSCDAQQQLQQQQYSHFKQVVANPQNYFQNEVPVPFMTRSVSNLNQVPIQDIDGQLVNNDSNISGDKQRKNESLLSSLIWRQWPTRGMPTSTATNQTNDDANSIRVKSGRSKSRDLGSLFSNAQQQQTEDQIVVQDHHYDNNDGHSNRDNLLNDRLQSGVVTSEKGASKTSNHLVRSQTDCSHLMGRFFGEPGYLMGGKPAMLLNHSQQQQQEQGQHPQQQQQQQQHHPPQQVIDRRMINRHYHVYEHEFYPPRLINSPQDGKQHSINFINHQPTLSRCPNQSQLRASVRSNQSNGCVIQDQNVIGSLNSPGQCSQRDLVLRNNSRLSLNIDAQTRDLGLDDHRHQLAMQQQQQQQQYHPIDRFVSRHSKKAARNGILPQMQTAGFACEQKRQELIELQRRLMAGQQHQQQLHQQQQLHNSYSLESHLSEPYLFGSARNALIQDFDQMIGNELLNKKHIQTIEDDLHNMQRPEAMLGSKQSILTGISLDMDRYGEHLTVSGTRITMPEKSVNTVPQDNQQDQAKHETMVIGSCSPVDQKKEARNKRKAVSPSSSIGGESVSLGTRTSPADLVIGPEPEKVQPPPKPARPSLAGKRNREQCQQDVHGGIIYDLPTTAESKKPTGPPLTIGPAAAQVSSQQLSSGKGSRAAFTEPPKVPPPPPPPPPTAASVMAHKVAAAAAAAAAAAGITFSKSSSIEKDALTNPLTVVAPSNDQSTTNSQSSNNSHDSSLDSAGNNGTEQFGLLKMASITSNSSSNSSSSRLEGKLVNLSSRHKTSQTIVNNNSNPKDPDSGVCTSNSPASMSHDSEGAPSADRETGSGEELILQAVVGNPKKVRQNMENNTSSAVVRHLARRLAPASYQLLGLNHQQLDTITSPPSPKTAQMCIEEALMPLTKTSSEQPKKMATVTTMTSPMTAQATTEAIDRWLTIVKKDDDDAESRGESDYENCQAMRQQIRIAVQNCNLDFTNDLSNTNTVCNAADRCESSEESNEAVEGGDDDDYADSVSLDENSSSTSSSSSLETNLELTERETALEQAKKLGHSRQREENQMKEITLKVVIDANETDKSGEEVFYINPSELKKISTKQRSQLSDAQTLTEEELCATIDKNSGYIRFTLKKRRNQTDAGEEGMVTSIPALNGSLVPQQIRDIKRADALCAAAKKTRFHLSYDKSPSENISSALGSRRHSELSSNCISIVKNKPNSTSIATQNQSLSSSQNDIILTGSENESRSSDLNNNNNSNCSINHLKLIDKQAASDLKRWFSINLAGLIEYSQKFVQNGFDNLQFLNHPTLMNDQLLKSIGIQDQSHRILILDRVYKELEQVNFDLLFNSNSQVTNNRNLTTPNLLKVLQLSHLVSTPNIDKIYNLGTRESVNLLKEKYCLSLPLGYRIRISSAIDFLLNKFLIPTNENQQRQPPRKDLEQQPITKQASVESNSSEVDMDISQASSVATTSSSSSKDSIKSIVQMKQQQRVQVSEETGRINQGVDQQLVGSKSYDSSGAKTKFEEREELQEQNFSSMKAQVVEQSKKVDDVTSASTLSTESKIVGDKPFVAVIATGKQGRTSSLVSEAARKLEAVAAQKSSGAFPLPVAAARRINNTNINNSQVNKAQIPTSNNVSKERDIKSSLVVDKPQNKSGEEEGDKKSTVFRNKTPFVPVKSINWPPKKQDKDSEVLLSTNNDDSTSSTGKSSFQRYIEDLNSTKNSLGIDKENSFEQQQQEQAIKCRPKPALPAKPAKLAANRYIFENNKS